MTDREALVLTVAFALTKCRPHLRAILQSGDADVARELAARTIVQQLELSGFEFRRRPPAKGNHMGR